MKATFALLVLSGLGVGSLQAGMVPLLGNNPVPVNAGFFAGGMLSFTATGVVSLGVGFNTNPDGSTVGTYQSPYGYFNPNGASYDIAPPSWDTAYIATDPCGNSWNTGYADEGVKATNLSTPGAIPLGSVAAVFSSSSVSPFPTNCNTGWFLAVSNNSGIYSGTAAVPQGGGYLWLVVPDTYYLNNGGGFNLIVQPLPEPSTTWLTVMGFVLLFAMVIRHRRRSSL